MNWELLFIVAMPATVAALIIWMIAAGYAKTDGMPPDTGENPYPERYDAIARWVIGVATAVIYGIVAARFGLRAAAILFAVLLLIDAVGALAWTAGEELIARRRSAQPTVSFGTRLFRNIRDFYVHVVLGVVVYG